MCTGLENKKGMTLVELMLAAALAGIIFSGISLLYVATSREGMRQQKISQRDAGANIAVHLIRKRLRNHSLPSITQLLAGGKAVGFSTSSDGTNYHIYVENDSLLHRTNGGQPVTLIDDGVEWIDTITDDNVVKVSFSTTTSLEGGGSADYEVWCTLEN